MIQEMVIYLDEQDIDQALLMLFTNNSVDFQPISCLKLQLNYANE